MIRDPITMSQTCALIVVAMAGGPGTPREIATRVLAGRTPTRENVQEAGFIIDRMADVGLVRKSGLYFELTDEGRGKATEVMERAGAMRRLAVARTLDGMARGDMG